MLALVSQAAGYGFAAGTTPGPFLSYLVNITLNQGWRQGLLVIFAPLISDGPIILLMVLLLKELPPGAQRVIQIGGGLFVLYLAWGAWKQFQARVELGAEEAVPSSRRTFLQGVMMNFLSPGPYIFWGSVTGPLLVQGLEQSVGHGLAFLGTFYGVFLSMLAVVVIVFDRARRIDERVTRGILLVTILVLGGLGLYLIVQGLGILV